MLRIAPLLILLTASLFGVEIVDRPIPFGKKRIALTEAYIEQHYGITGKGITITPRLILIHATGIDDLNDSLSRFTSETLAGSRPDIQKGGAVNVSAHFMVDFDGTIYRLMEETTMGRHVIGLNYSSIGIENVGGAHGYGNLTDAQLEANRQLVAYLTGKYPTITYLIGHHEYRCMERTPLWLEQDPDYRTDKTDPGPEFMKRLRVYFPTLKRAPCVEADDR
jgi:hypothetical protein